MMNNWKRIIAAAGTAALLISNLGSISQLAFATEPAAESAVNADEPESGGSQESGGDQGTILEGEETESKDIGDGTGSLGDGSDQKGSGDDASDNDENDSEDADEADEETSEDEESEDESDPSDEEQGTDGEEPPVTDPAADIPATEPEEGTPAEEQPAVYSLDDSLEVSLETRESSKRDVKRNDDGDYLYNIGETASTTIRISNPENYALDENDNAVVRLYMQFTDTASTDEHANGAQGKTKSPGTYMLPADDDTEYRYTVYEIKDGLYGYEFERPIKGDSYEVELTSIYKDDTEGGTNRIWTAILAEDEAEELDRDVAEESPEQSDNADANHDDSSNDVENYASDDAGAEEPSEENTDDDHVIGIADLPEDEDDIITLRWADPETAYPAFEDEQTMADGTVITIDAPEGAFPEGTRLALEVKDAEDYLDAIRAYKGDETLTADGWLAYDFDFYTDDDHHNIEPLSRIKVTFSNLTRLTELAEQAAEAGSEETASDDAGSDGIMLTDLAEDAEETDTVGTTGGSDTTESGESTGANVAVYHIADSTEDGDDENVAGTVTETTVTDVDAEAGVIEIESDQFSVQLLDLNDGIMLAAYNSNSVDHIDIDLRITPKVTVDGKEYTSSMTLLGEDYTSDRVTITGTYNGNVIYGPRTSYTNSDLSDSTDTGGNAQKRVNDTFYIGTLNDPVYYTVELTKDCVFTASDGSTFTIPVTFSTRFCYFQSDNVCPGLMGNNAATGYISRQAGMDYEISTYSFGLLKEVRDADTKELINPIDGDYKVSFDIANGGVTKTMNISVGSNGIGYGVMGITGSTTVTESRPPSSVQSGDATYEYDSTTINNGATASKTLTASGTASTGWVVTNYYSGKPLVVEKKWYEKDGKTEITDNNRLPSSITGTLYQHDYAPATPGKEADNGVTLTVKVKYRYGDLTPTKSYTYTVATGGTFSGYVYGYYTWRRQNYERTIASITRTSGSATVSNSGNTITVSNITQDTTVLVSYSTDWNSYLDAAPVINNVNYDKPDGTSIDPTDEVNVTRQAEFELTADGGWKKKWTSKDLANVGMGQKSGHTYNYWVVENAVDGYRTNVDFGSQETSLNPTTDKDKTITITNIKNPDVRIKKVDADHTELNGATFTLSNESGQYYDGATDKFVDVTTEALPSVSMGALDLSLADGTYTLTEIKAPDGYNKADPITLVVAGGTVKVNEKELPQDTDGYYLLEAINTPGYVLPDTGGSGTVPFEVGGSAAILASMFAGCSMWRRRRSERRCG